MDLTTAFNNLQAAVADVQTKIGARDAANSVASNAQSEAASAIAALHSATADFDAASAATA